MRNGRQIVALLSVALLLAGCGDREATPGSVSPLLEPSSTGPQPADEGTSPTLGSPGRGPSPSYVLTDVEVLEVEDPVAQLIWAVRFDADWTGEGAGPGITCKWRMYDPYGDQNALGVVDVTEDLDITTDFVYPDEIAGRPTTARVVCP